MNLKKGKFKIVEGTRVRMVSSKDTHIVEGAYGTVVNPGIRESEVRWDSMLAIRADYRYRNELEDALIIPVYNDLLDPSGNFQIWTPEPIARIYLDDCIKYIGEDTKDLKYGDLLCVYSMTLSEHSLYAIQLSNYKLHKLDKLVKFIVLITGQRCPMKLLWTRVIVFGLLDVPYRMLILKYRQTRTYWRMDSLDK